MLVVSGAQPMGQFEKLIGKNPKALPPGKHGDGRGLYMVVERALQRIDERKSSTLRRFHLSGVALDHHPDRLLGHYDLANRPAIGEFLQ
jgi:hypothetical protein